MAKLESFLFFMAQLKPVQFTISDVNESKQRNLYKVCIYKIKLKKKLNESDKRSNSKLLENIYKGNERINI